MPRASRTTSGGRLRPLRDRDEGHPRHTPHTKRHTTCLVAIHCRDGYIARTRPEISQLEHPKLANSENPEISQLEPCEIFCYLVFPEKYCRFEEISSRAFSSISWICQTLIFHCKTFLANILKFPQNHDFSRKSWFPKNFASGARRLPVAPWSFPKIPKSSEGAQAPGNPLISTENHPRAPHKHSPALRSR